MHRLGTRFESKAEINVQACWLECRHLFWNLVGHTVEHITEISGRAGVPRTRFENRAEISSQAGWLAGVPSSVLEPCWEQGLQTELKSTVRLAGWSAELGFGTLLGTRFENRTESIAKNRTEISGQAGRLESRGLFGGLLGTRFENRAEISGWAGCVKCRALCWNLVGREVRKQS
jgi:hypothetical protein